jgi:hypothetical protein
MRAAVGGCPNRMRFLCPGNLPEKADILRNGAAESF